MTSSKLLLTGRTITHLPLQYKQYKLPAYLLCYAFTIKALLISSTYLHSSPSLSSFSFPLDTIIFTSHTRTIKAVALTHHSHLRLSHSSPSPSSLSPATLTRHHPLHHSLATITFITLTRHHRQQLSLATIPSITHSPPSPTSLTHHHHLHPSHSSLSPSSPSLATIASSSQNPQSRYISRETCLSFPAINLDSWHAVSKVFHAVMLQEYCVITSTRLFTLWFGKRVTFIGKTWLETCSVNFTVSCIYVKFCRRYSLSDKCLRSKT